MRLTPEIARTGWIFLFGLLLCLTPLTGETASSPSYNASPENLQELLDQAAPGDRILLQPGRYVGNFEIHQPVSLQGQPGAILTSAHQGTVLRVFAPDVQLENLEVRDSGTNITDRDACIYTEKAAAQIQIRNNHIEGCAWGIWIHESPEALVENNTVIGTTQKILSRRGNGIHLFHTQGSIVRENRISLGRDGLYISNSEDVLLENNTMRNTRFGIHYMYSYHCRVIGNKTYDSHIGAAIMYSKNLSISGNHFENNTEHGILFRDVLHSTIEKNTSEKNLDGFFLGSSYFNTIRENRFSRNQLAGKVSNGSKDNQVFRNDFIDNQQQVQFLDRKSVVWSHEGSGNFWSHYLGWDRDRNGVGDTKFLVTRVSDQITADFPALKIILHSPAMQLLQKIENRFPVFQGPVIIDEYPLMRPATL